MVDIAPRSFAEVAYLSTIRMSVYKNASDVPNVGCAFGVEKRSGERFLVTAAHLIAGASAVTLFMYPGENGPSLELPRQYHVANPGAFWTPHPDPAIDIAVADLNLVGEFFQTIGEPVFLSTIRTEDIAAQWVHREPFFTDPFHHPLPLDEVVIIGYPEDYRDVNTCMPLLRRGHMATPYWLDHEGRPVFLVDAAVSPGTSGGPVLYVEEMHRVGKHLYGDTGQISLLGVFSEVLPPRADGSGERRTPSNLGAAYKAYSLFDLIGPDPEPTEEVGPIEAGN